MIVDEVAKNVEKIISIDTAKNSFQVLVVNQKVLPQKCCYLKIGSENCH